MLQQQHTSYNNKLLTFLHCHRYGDVVGLFIGRRPVVILSNPEHICQAFAMEELADRPPFDDTQALRGGSGKDTGAPGIILINGKSWVEQRRFALKTLRDFGLGKDGMEALVADEVEALCKRIEAISEKGPVHMEGFFDESALKALWKVLTNEEFDVANSDLPHIWRRMQDVFKHSNYTSVQLATQRPLLTPLLQFFKVETFAIALGVFDKVISQVVSKHEDNFQEDSLLDFTDVYIKQMRDNADNPSSSFHGQEGKRNINAVLSDLVQAGTDTTSNTLTWAMLFMAKNPDVQRQVQEELDNIIGSSRLATWSDRHSLPFTEATLHETQRMANLVPFGLQRQTSRDIKIGGYLIPENTQVYAFLGRVMLNPCHFPDPLNFNPSRFVGTDGKFEPSPLVIPFGVGKRRCLGETLAKMELFRFFTGVLQRFFVTPAIGEDLNLVSGSLGGLNAASSFSLQFNNRQ